MKPGNRFLFCRLLPYPMHPQRRLLESVLSESGDLMRELFGKRKTISYKKPRDVVTNADKAVEKLVFRRVREAGLPHALLCEESGYSEHWGTREHRRPSPTADYTWVVDPVDGTSNFAHENPLFCTSIGLQRNGRVELAGVCVPMLGETFLAEYGRGAFLNGRRIRVSKERDFRDLVIAVERQPDKRLVTESLKVEERLAPHHRLRTLGSVAIDLCFVACGRYDAFYANSIFIWDCSAGKLLVEEAGGKVTHADGSPVDLSQRKFGLAASNPGLHAKFLAALRKNSK